jgi:hypothetical protein
MVFGLSFLRNRGNLQKEIFDFVSSCLSYEQFIYDGWCNLFNMLYLSQIFNSEILATVLTSTRRVNLMQTST